MALQNISPLNDQLADIIVRSDEPWIESEKGMAWMKVLWTGPETGRWAALFRWNKGYTAAPHKHLSDAHTFILKGKLQVRDGVLNSGDYDYEPNGVLHGATTALEDTEYLFICDGPVLFFNEDGLTNYLGWEELSRMRDAAKAGQATSLAVSATAAKKPARKSAPKTGNALASTQAPAPKQAPASKQAPAPKQAPAAKTGPELSASSPAHYERRGAVTRDDGPGGGRGMARPVLGGAGWRPLFTPRDSGVYVNDHCVLQGPSGHWHVFGITKPTPDIGPHGERWFCHGAGRSLGAGNFRELGRVCDFGTRAWAPAVAFDGQRWVMLYGPDRLRAAICDDDRLESWHEAPCSLVGAPPFGVMRDGMIVRLDDDSWLLYSTAKRGRLGAVSVCISENLLDWRFVRYVFRTTATAPKQPPWGATESPFVFVRDGRWWLSITYTGSGAGPADYHDTVLFTSDDPFEFGSWDGGAQGVAARLYSHAPEYLREPGSGQWYITSAGWHGEAFGTVIPGSVAIRELDWQD